MITRIHPMLYSRTVLALLAAAAAGCPKPAPGDPVPADECKKDGQACAGKPGPEDEGPPKVGEHAPPPR